MRWEWDLASLVATLEPEVPAKGLCEPSEHYNKANNVRSTTLKHFEITYIPKVGVRRVR